MQLTSTITDQNFFNTVPKDILYNIFRDVPKGALLVNKRLNDFAKDFFKVNNEQIISLYPRLKNVFEEKKLKNMSHFAIFMQLINRLHDQAKIMNCDQTFNNEKEFRVLWEHQNFQNLAIAVNNAYQTNRRMMAYDFMKFVDTIEGKVKQKVMFFKSYNEKDVNWEADKKNHEVFESLLKDPNIVNVKKITLDCLDFIPPEIGQLTDLEELYISEG